jgi:alpha-amylase
MAAFLRKLLVGALALLALETHAAPPAVARLPQPGTGQVFYFVMTDRFSNGRTANDHAGMVGGPEVDGFDPARISHYHGGDFVGLTNQLDYIKGLGVSALWVTPPFKNKAMQSGTAGYHGYWILDFTQIDPHLGTEAEFREFVRQAHARGIKVFLDIVVNHTADVIAFADGQTDYRDVEHHPLRDADGNVLSLPDLAFNGTGARGFPALSAEKSFARVPVVAADETHAKAPEWLNDVTLYHNRGNSTFRGESSLYGDFVGLDDVMTEHPKVVEGFTDVYARWIRDYRIDGFRIDTLKHVNTEFWQAFCGAIHREAARAGVPDFFMFGEVSSEHGDPRLLSEFSTVGTVDATLDFGFFEGAREYISRRENSSRLYERFAADDLYTDHDSGAYAQTTFLGNHDAGRFAYFLRQDNPGITDAELLERLKLGNALLLLSRGEPVLYYGDEQGMAGIGNDMGAREDMFASQSPQFRELKLAGSSRTGADDKFDASHPLYGYIADLSRFRREHAAFRSGAMILRPSADARVFAFSRIDRDERVEFLVALNQSKTSDVVVDLPVSVPAGAKLKRVVIGPLGEDARDQVLVSTKAQTVKVRLRPLESAVWRADAPLPVPARDPQLHLTSLKPSQSLSFKGVESDGHVFSRRAEIAVKVEGSDDVGEVTFLMSRASRPDQYELLGVDDAPPHRVFWRPSPDLPESEELTFIALFDDLRGHRAVAQVEHVRVAERAGMSGVRGASVPRFTVLPQEIGSGTDGVMTLSAAAEGEPEPSYQWYKDGRSIPGASSAKLELGGSGADRSGSYFLAARNVAGTTLTREIIVGRGSVSGK